MKVIELTQTQIEDMVAKAIANFHYSGMRNKWVYLRLPNKAAIGHIYLRYNKLFAAVELANIEIIPLYQRRGLSKETLRQLVDKYQIVICENVINEHLYEYLSTLKHSKLPKEYNELENSFIIQDKIELNPNHIK